MLVYISNSIRICQLFKQNSNKVLKKAMTKLEQLCIIIQVTHYKIQFYYFVIWIRIELRKHMIHIPIRATSAPHSYLMAFVFKFVFFLKI
jgi:hypothetical protein